jgi:hexokinase
MGSLPDHLQTVLQDLEDQFTISAEKLKAITSRFESELAKGMMPRISTWPNITNRPL